MMKRFTILIAFARFAVQQSAATNAACSEAVFLPGSSCVVLKSESALYFPMEVSAKLQVQLASHFVHDSNVGMVTCEPKLGPNSKSNYRIRLRTMLDLPVPAHANYLHSKYLQGNCTDFFIYVATQITGPIAVRRSAWGTLESTNYLFEKQLVPENNSAPMTPAARLSLQLWDRGWHVAMVQCPEQEKPTLINDPMFAPFMVTPPDDRVHDSTDVGPIAARMGHVESMNTHLLDLKLRHMFPLAMNMAARVRTLNLTLPLSSDNADGITCVIMTYKSSANAELCKRKARDLVDQIPETLLKEVVIIWNTDHRETFSPTSSFASDIPRTRLVIAPTNDLLNRYDMKLVAPKTAAIMLLDDDDAPPSHALLLNLSSAWRLHGGKRVVGVTSRGPPIKLKHTVIGHQQLCEPNYIYLGHGNEHPPNEGEPCWFVEPNKMIFHRDLARAFLSDEHLPMHRFIRAHPTHPDDICFGTFAGWYTALPALQLPTIYNPARRRLGMSGGGDWLFLRSNAVMWTLHYFGGFQKDAGCWVSTRDNEHNDVWHFPDRMTCSHLDSEKD